MLSTDTTTVAPAPPSRPACSPERYSHSGAGARFFPPPDCRKLHQPYHSPRRAGHLAAPTQDKRPEPRPAAPPTPTPCPSPRRPLCATLDRGTVSRTCRTTCLNRRRGGTACDFVAAYGNAAAMTSLTICTRSAGMSAWTVRRTESKRRRCGSRIGRASRAAASTPELEEVTLRLAGTGAGSSNHPPQTTSPRGNAGREVYDVRQAQHTISARQRQDLLAALEDARRVRRARRLHEVRLQVEAGAAARALAEGRGAQYAAVRRAGGE